MRVVWVWVSRILAAAADLAPGIEVGAISNRAVFPGDAEHVGGMVEAGETRQRGRVGYRGRPDAVLDLMHREGRRHAAPVVPDVTPGRLAAHQFYVLGVWRPDRKANRRFGLARDELLVRAQPTAMSQVITLGLIGGAQRETAVTFGDGSIADFGGNTPHVGPLRGVDIHAPAEGLADLAIVEIDRDAEGGAAIFRRERFH